MKKKQTYALQSLLMGAIFFTIVSCSNNAIEEEGPFSVPDVVGMNLQGAQDCLQRYGFYNLDDQPSYGEPKFQVNDSNWTVVGQDRSVVYAKDERITLRAKNDGGQSDIQCPQVP